MSILALWSTNLPSAVNSPAATTPSILSSSSSVAILLVSFQAQKLGPIRMTGTMRANKRGENRFGPLRHRYPLSPALHWHRWGWLAFSADLATWIFPLLIERVSSGLSKLLRSIVAIAFVHPFS